MKRTQILLVTSMVLMLGALAWGQGSPYPGIRLQGSLSDLSGTPVTGTVGLTVRIYAAPTGGSPLYLESFSSVTVTNGLLNLVIGSGVGNPDSIKAALAATPANPERWVGITIASDPELSPRIMLNSTPNSFRVSTVDGAKGGTLTGDLTVSGADRLLRLSRSANPTDTKNWLFDVTPATGDLLFAIADDNFNQLFASLTLKRNGNVGVGTSPAASARLNIDPGPNAVDVGIGPADKKWCFKVRVTDDGLAMGRASNDFATQDVILVVNRTNTKPTLTLVQPAAGQSRMETAVADGELVLAGGPDVDPDDAEVVFCGGSHATTPGALLLYTGGAERMRIDNAGNIGIGETPAAVARLAIRPGPNAVALGLGNASKQWCFALRTTDGAMQLASASDDFSLRTVRLTIDRTNGRVGIGTESPAADLDVAGSCKMGTTSTDQFTCNGTWTSNAACTFNMGPVGPTIHVASYDPSRAATVFKANYVGSGDVVEVTNNTNAIVWRCDNSGKMYCSELSATGTLTVGGTIQAAGGGGGSLLLDGGGVGGGTIFLDGSSTLGGVTIDPGPAGRLTSQGDLLVNGALQVTGAKSAVVPTSQGMTRLYAQESPENWFEDFGEGRLSNGRAQIDLDPLFLETVSIDDKYPMKVFVQPNDDFTCYVKRNMRGFEVIQTGGKKGAGAFTYRIVAKRKGFERDRLEMAGALSQRDGSHNSSMQ